MNTVVHVCWVSKLSLLKASMTVLQWEFPVPWSVKIHSRQGTDPLPSYKTTFNINIRQFRQAVSQWLTVQRGRHLSLPKSREPPVVPYGPNHAIDNGWETGVHVIHGTMFLGGVLVGFTILSFVMMSFPLFYFHMAIYFWFWVMHNLFCCK